MDYDTIQKKLDCLSLTAKISKARSNEIEGDGKIESDNQLCKATLGNIMRIKRTEERVLTRLDYWIYGQLTNYFEGESNGGLFSRNHRRSGTSAEEDKQVWDFDVEASSEGRRRISSDTAAGREGENQIVRSVSSTKAEPTKRRSKPWITRRSTKKEDSISMFAYDPKSRLEVDDSMSAGTILRRSMFSRFGTINSRKLKMFFSREHNSNDDTKSRKSVTSENPHKLSSSSKEKLTAMFFKTRNREKDKCKSESHENQCVANNHVKVKPRPKSLACYDFDLDGVSIPASSISDINANLPEDEDNKRKTFKERLRSMPVFYVPSSRKGRLKVFE